MTLIDGVIVAKKRVLIIQSIYLVDSTVVSASVIIITRNKEDHREKPEQNNDYQIIDPLKTMAEQMIIDSHLVREYERIFLPMEHW